MVRLGRAFLRFLLGSGGTSTQQMTRGSIWAFASYGMGQVLLLGRSVILARLLVPADFGLINLAMVLIGALQIFTETGIWPALVRRKQLDDETLHTAWIISGVRNLLLAAITFLTAPLMAWFFNTPSVIPILRVIALTFIIGAFNSLSPILLQRSLDFKTLTWYNVVTETVNTIFVIAAALLLGSYWAIVIGLVAGSIAGLILSYLIHSYRPRLRWSRTSARELLGFGRFITLAGVVTYLTQQGDNAYVGKTLGVEPLGLYAMAYRLANMPALSISNVLNRVTLPTFSTHQDDLPELRNLYTRTLRLTALIAIPMAASMMVLAPYIVNVLYGPKWLPMVPSFIVLCIFGLERCIGAIAGPVFLALGKPKLILWLGLIKLVTMFTCMIPLTKLYGILGTSIAVTISAIMVEIFVMPAAARLLRMPVRRILGQLWLPAVGTLLAIVPVLLLGYLGPWADRNLASLVGLSLVLAFVYGSFVLLALPGLTGRINGLIHAGASATDHGV